MLRPSESMHPTSLTWVHCEPLFPYVASTYLPIYLSWGALQCSSGPQPPRCGRGGGGPEGEGGSKIFLHFGGVFDFPVSF